MEAGPTKYWSYQFQAIAACALFLVASGVFSAQGGPVRFSDVDASLPRESAGAALSAAIGGLLLPLRASEALTSARTLAVGSQAASIATGRTDRPLADPRLQLDRALASPARLVAFRAMRALPQGDLNRTGIVRASAVQIRDGALFLVGEYIGHEDSPQVADDIGERN